MFSPPINSKCTFVCVRKAQNGGEKEEGIVIDKVGEALKSNITFYRTTKSNRPMFTERFSTLYLSKW